MTEQGSSPRRASIMTDDFIAETIYIPEEQKTLFARYDLHNIHDIHNVGSITLNGEQFLPLNAKKDLVNKGVILLPSEATEYGTDMELFKEIQGFIHKRLDISESFEPIAASYVLLSWLYDRFNELPYLRARGDYGSGKTRFLQVIGSICYRPIITGGATTTSPIFRILDQVHGTLILDEADFSHSDEKSDLVKILNTGYQKGIAVLRSEGKGSFEVKSYDVYGPKIIATRQNFQDQALESRFLIEDMGHGNNLRSDIPIRLDDAFYDEARRLRNKLLMWRFRNYHKPLIFNEGTIEGLQPRLQQIAIPILTIALDDTTKQTIIEHIKRYGEELTAARGLSWEYDVILAILRLRHKGERDGCTMKDIAEETNRSGEFGEDTLGPRKIGWILRAKLQLKSISTRRGFELSLSKNKGRLDFWQNRFGITDAIIQDKDVDVVNDVNVTSEKKERPEITRDDIPF